MRNSDKYIPHQSICDIFNDSVICNGNHQDDNMTAELYRFGTEMEQTKNDLAGLNDVYREIADEIGLENTLIIFRLFHGTQVSFPNRLFSKEYIHHAIISEYDGTNIAQLAQKYNYSERTVWRILKAKTEE